MKFRPLQTSLKLLSLCIITLALPVHAAQGLQVSVMHGWPAQQGDAFEQIIQAFEARHPEIDVQAEVVGRDRPAVLATRLAAGNPPDITPHPWLGLQTQWARQGKIKSLEGRVDPGALLEALKPLGIVDGKLYGLFLFPNVKSVVWYNPKVFTARGYAIPRTWEELRGLAHRIIAEGGTPWALGLESGPASGWPGTDWIEDILLRTAGAGIYDQWVAHEIPWTHPAVRRAFELFGDIALDSKMVLGGPLGALTTNFGDAPGALFTQPPQALLHRQATFIQGFIGRQNPDLTPGADYDIFPLPPLSTRAAQGAPVVVGGDLLNCFSDRPEVIEFARFLISAEAQGIWVKRLGELSSNRSTSADLFTNPISKKAWRILSDAEVIRYDASDAMPAAVGTGTFWSGVLDYVSGIPLDRVLETIEASARDAYGP
jgi:alpha-glucoside transport system substrate-binding protein